MFVTCWTAKGGSGTSVVAAGLAILYAQTSPTLLIDGVGDTREVFGCDDRAMRNESGVLDWLVGDSRVPASRLAGLEVRVSDSLSFLPMGGVGISSDSVRGLIGTDEMRQRFVELRSWLGQRNTVVDAGSFTNGDDDAVLGWRTDRLKSWHAIADRSLLVMRTCYMSIVRAKNASIRPNGVVLVDEPGRMYTAEDVRTALGVPVVATIPWDMQTARAIDAGRISRRLPRTLERALRKAS